MQSLCLWALNSSVALTLMTPFVQTYIFVSSKKKMYSVTKLLQVI